MIGRQLEAGSFIRFTYQGESTDQPFKEVMVLNPSWNGKMHGLDLKRMTPAEVEVLRAVMDPATKQRPHRIPMVNDILKRMDPVELIKNPVGFYARFVRPFIHGKDCYRQYWPSRMSAIQTIKGSTVTGHVENPMGAWRRPLFKK